MYDNCNMLYNSAFIPVQGAASFSNLTPSYYAYVMNPYLFPSDIPVKNNIKRRRPTKYNKVPKFNYAEEIINDAVDKYQKLEYQKVKCSICGNNVELLKSFGLEDKFTCLDCAVKVYETVGELPDWEHELEYNKSDSACPCQRIKHTKNLSSFVRYNNKSGEYELGQLCTYCRNVKRFEYLRKQSKKRSRDENDTCYSNNVIDDHPIKKAKILVS